MTQRFPFPTNPDATSIVMAFRNKRLIADEAMPRFPVKLMNYWYAQYKLEDGFTVPDTAVGRKSVPNQIEFPSTRVDRSTKDHALDDVVPIIDVENDGGNSLKTRINRTSEMLANVIALDREIRVSNLLFDPANYPDGHKETLDAETGFGNANSDPIGLITDAMDTLLIRPNTMLFGRAAFTRFARHPKVVKACHGNSGDSGFARRQQIAELFEVDKVLVGKARVNIRRPGQPAVLERVWGPHLALYYLDVLGGPEENPSFCFTAEFGTRIAGDIPKPELGMRGSRLVRVGESVDEVIAAPMLGYLFENAGAAPAAP